METSTKKWTYEDYLALEDDNRYEIFEGELIMVPSPLEWHQKASANLGFMLQNFVRGRGLGKVYYAPFDVVLDKGVVFQPDILFVSKEGLEIIRERGVFGPPDLIIEIVSPSNLFRDIESKKRLYEKYGVKEYWIVFPAERAIEVLTLTNKGYELFSFAGEKGKVKSNLLTGFEADLIEVFE